MLPPDSKGLCAMLTMSQKSVKITLSLFQKGDQDTRWCSLTEVLVNTWINKKRKISQLFEFVFIPLNIYKFMFYQPTARQACRLVAQQIKISILAQHNTNRLLISSCQMESLST